MSSGDASLVTPRISYGSADPIDGAGGAASGRRAVGGGRRLRVLGRLRPALAEVAHRALRRRLWSRRHSSIRAWWPESEHVGHVPAAELGRPRVVRVLEPAVELGREALDPRRLLAASRAGQEPRDGVDDDHRGSSPPERTYGPIEIASEQRWTRIRSSKPSKRAESSVSRSSPASSSTTCWSSGRPCGVSATTRWLGHAAVDGVERRRGDVDAQHHPGPAAVRLVVDLAGAQRA